MEQNSQTISLTNQNKPCLFSNLVLWNNHQVTFSVWKRAANYFLFGASWKEVTFNN